MTDQNPEVKKETPELHHVYNTDQQVSVNAFIDIDINGEAVRFQVSNRYGSTAEKIVKTTEAAITAFSMLRALYPRPVAQNTIPARDENNTPIIDAQTGEALKQNLPDGVHLYTVAGLVHDKNKEGTKDILKVFTVEAPYHKGYGVSCFHPPAELKGFTAWAVTSKENKAMYAPPESCKHVLIRDPKDGSKYADVVEFRP